jgi:predicted ArsR family transcriptional regulator
LASEPETAAVPADAGAESSGPASLSLMERRERLVETVRRQQFAAVTDLSAAFGVSGVTIRNDLDVLAE